VVGRSVGLVRVELTTSRLSGVRSNHLSYRPTSCAAGRPRIDEEREGQERTGVPRLALRDLRLARLARRLTLRFRASSHTQKGGDPAAPSGTATLLRLHPPHQAYLRRRPPCG
jgi:hypothetical protein